MKEITTNKGTFLFVEVPDNAYDFRLGKIRAGSFVEYKTCDKFPTKKIIINLKKLKVKIISATKDITKEQAESVVEKSTTDSSDIFGIGCIYFVDYTNKNNTLFENSKESLQSLIQANRLDVNKNYLILLKK